MAVEWIATTVIGVAGIAGTYWTGREGREAAERARREEHAHQERMAREARIQQRRADAYAEMLRIAEMVGNWAQQLRPILELNPPIPLPPLPTVEEQSAARARVHAFASTAVKQLFDAWNDSAQAIRLADFKIGSAIAMREKHGNVSMSYHDEWMALEDTLRPAERTARLALAEAAHAELDAERTLS